MANNKLSICLKLEIYQAFLTFKKRKKTLKTREINACFKFNKIKTRIELKLDHITSTG